MTDAHKGLLDELLAALTKLPGIGPKSAERIAYFLLSGDRSRALALAEVLQRAARQMRPCQECFNLADQELCAICRDPRRDGSLLCVVETPRDVAAFERLGTYRGRYHVLGGRLAPLEGVGPEQLHLDALVERVRRHGVREVILATSPTLEGDGTALYVANILTPTGVTVTRLARGLPSGSSLELANPQMLSEALEGRRALT